MVVHLFAVLLVALGQYCSLLFLSNQTIQVGKEDATMHTLFAESFATLGRLDNVTLVMVFHPQYLESFLKTQHYLLQMDGPLPLHYRHYIGIMVRTRRKPPRQPRLVSCLRAAVTVLHFIAGKAFHQQLREKQSRFVGVCFTHGFRRTALYVHRFGRTVRKRGKACSRNETIVTGFLSSSETVSQESLFLCVCPVTYTPP